MARADRKFLKVAVERGYLDSEAAQVLLAECERSGASAEELVRDRDLLSARRLERLRNHVRYRAMRKCDKAYAEVAVRSQAVTQEQAQAGLSEQRQRFEASRERVRLGTLLVEQGLLSESSDRQIWSRIPREDPSGVGGGGSSAGGAVSDPTRSSGARSSAGGRVARSGGARSSAGGRATRSGGARSSAGGRVARSGGARSSAGGRVNRSGADAQPSGQKAAPAERTAEIPQDGADVSSADVDVTESSQQVSAARNVRDIDAALQRVEDVRSARAGLSTSGEVADRDSAAEYENACRVLARRRAKAAEKPTAEQAPAPRKVGPRAGVKKSTGAVRQLLGMA